jgi:hypothetical protein
MNKPLGLSLSKLLFLFFLVTSLNVSSQEIDEIIKAYNKYTNPPREVVYLHLNKSTYIIGETIGFTAYVLDKKNKKPSLLTTNLYVSIEDKEQNIVAQKLILIKNGIASNTFETDSTFNNGNYKIKAYTNWMLNFNERNHFTETITIKNQNIKDTKQLTSMSLDAQFLPESGHLLNNVKNNVGVIIKDQEGFGIPHSEGVVIDKNNNIITSFKTNKFGVGRFIIKPKIAESYKVKINRNNDSYTFNFTEKIEKNGVILSVKQLKNKFIVSSITNTNTLKSIKNKPYYLLIHNGETAQRIDISFNNDEEIVKILEIEGNKGINIITLFNENNQPISERLVFNYEGISILNSDYKTTLTEIADSLSINLKMKAIDTTQFHNLSISVLPNKTKSYQRHHSLLSYNFLKPYVRGNIENAKYYFTDIDDKKKFELDNLLITQGWSSYSWETIFNNDLVLSHQFEIGITAKANFPTKKNKDNTNLDSGLMYYLNDYGTRVAASKKEDSSYIMERLFPVEDNALQLYKISNKGTLKPASTYLQFYPSTIPKLNSSENTPLISRTSNISVTERVNNNVMFKSVKNIQKLEEVLVKAKLNPILERQNKLSARRFGNVTVIDKRIERSYPLLRNYLSTRGLIVIEGNSGLRARFQGAVGEEAVFFLNDVLLLDTSYLSNLFMSDVDFIEINKFAIGETVRGPGSGGQPRGVIKINLKKLSDRINPVKASKA